jgi:hypothetical protein
MLDGHFQTFIEEMIIPLDILAARENTLMMAAGDLLLSNEDINIVVFGHEHQYFTNELRPEVSGRRGKYHMNTGTWIPMLFLNRARRVTRLAQQTGKPSEGD